MSDPTVPRSIASRNGFPGASTDSWPTNSFRVRGRMRAASGAAGADPANNEPVDWSRRYGIVR
jgi:hypothetical protein